MQVGFIFNFAFKLIIMEKLKEDYISIDTRLEYMEAIAVKYVPDVDIDLATGERYVCGTTAFTLIHKEIQSE